jgi:hypothetical protein
VKQKKARSQLRPVERIGLTRTQIPLPTARVSVSWPLGRGVGVVHEMPMMMAR